MFSSVSDHQTVFQGGCTTVQGVSPSLSVLKGHLQRQPYLPDGYSSHWAAFSCGLSLLCTSRMIPPSAGWPQLQ